MRAIPLPALVPIVLGLTAACVGIWRGQWSLAAAAVLTAAAIPTARRMLTRKWHPGLGLRGLGFAFIAAHVPVILAVIRAVDPSHCGVTLCRHAMRVGILGAPVLALIAAVSYWAWAPEPPKVRTGVTARDLRP